MWGLMRRLSEAWVGVRSATRFTSVRWRVRVRVSVRVRVWVKDEVRVP